MPSVGAVLQRAAPNPSRRRLRDQRGERLGREGRRVGQAAGQRDDLGALGDRHQVAHRRGLHDRGPRGEQPRVALEVAPLTRRQGSPFRWFRTQQEAGRGVWTLSPPAPWPLSSTVMRASSYRTVKLLLDILQGHRGVRRHRCPPVPPDAARRRAGRRRSRHRLRPHRLRLPGEPVVPAGHRGRARGHDAAARALRDAGRRRRPSAASAWASARCSSPARSPTTTRRGGPGSSAAWPARSSPSRRTRSLLTRTRARLDAAAAAALFALRGRGRAADRGLSVLHPARQRARGRLLHLAAARRPPARGREVRRPAHPAVSRQARPRRHRRPEAGDARAGGRDRPRAGAGGRDGARHLRRRVRRGLPVGDAGRAPPRSPPACARTRHHIPSMNWYSRERAPLRRVRVVASAPRGASGSSSRSPTRSTT